jgi:hypothetical protein
MLSVSQREVHEVCDYAFFSIVGVCADAAYARGLQVDVFTVVKSFGLDADVAYWLAACDAQEHVFGTYLCGPVPSSDSARRHWSKAFAEEFRYCGFISL